MAYTSDFHLHTTASDGATNPIELIKEIQSIGLTTISITDHESLEGLKTAGPLAKEYGMVLIPGVELLTWYHDREIHLLGYWIGDMPKFDSWLKEKREKRNCLYLQIVDRLEQCGYNIDEEPLVSFASQEIALGKNHILKALYDAGYLTTREQIWEFLRRYLSPNGIVYPEFDFNPLMEAVEFIKECKGVAVLAHPGLLRNDELVLDILRNNDVGLEVYYHYFGDRDYRMVKHYEQMAGERGLKVITGGSDYHGYYSPDIKLGRVPIPPEAVASLQNARP